jgi:glycosyltransferase involved in cell wall biosynthesis
LPAPEGNLPLVRLPRLTHPAFLPVNRSADPALLAGLELPESYLLYQGPLQPLDVRRLLNAWSWAAPAIGEYYPLAIAGVDQSLKSTLLTAIGNARCESTVLLLPTLSVAGLAALYRGCSALIHPTTDSPWEGAISLAMACHKPVVALATPWSDALVGPAGYLVEAGEEQSTSRLLGAGLITVIVEEKVAESLAEQAAQRAAAWSSDEQTGRFTRHLAEVYSSLVAQQTSRH